MVTKQLDAEAERATKSIGGALTNSKMQNYYKSFKKQGGQSNLVANTIFLKSHPYSNYKPLPDQNIIEILNQQ